MDFRSKRIPWRIADFGVRGVTAGEGFSRRTSLVDPQKQIAAVVLMQVLPYYDDACIDVLRGFEKMAYQQLR